MELNASISKPKRERGHNWTTKEKIILFECVKDYLHIVSDWRHAVEVRNKKNLTWAWIAKLAKEMGVYVTETVKFKTQWKRMRIAAKKNIHAYQNGLAIDGKLVVPSELDWNVYNAITSVSVNKMRQKLSSDVELSQSNEIKQEISVDFAFDHMSSAVQISDDVYSIEDDSESSHSDISLSSHTSNIDQSNKEAKVYQEVESVLQATLHTDAQISRTQKYQKEIDDKLTRPNELDWNLYNVLTNDGNEKRLKSSDETKNYPQSEIKHELPDDFAFGSRTTTNQIPDDIKSNRNVSASPHSHISNGTQRSNFQPNNSEPKIYQNTESNLQQPPPAQQVLPMNSTTEHQHQLLAVQLKIEEAKLKEIEERIHQQRVIFELNKTLLQKQIENESVKKYNM